MPSYVGSVERTIVERPEFEFYIPAQGLRSDLYRNRS